MRAERDYWDDVRVPVNKLYGVNSARGVENLGLSMRTITVAPEFARAFVRCKRVALANHDLGVSTGAECKVNVGACLEITVGRRVDSQMVDFLDGSGSRPSLRRPTGTCTIGGGV